MTPVTAVKARRRDLNETILMQSVFDVWRISWATSWFISALPEDIPMFGQSCEVVQRSLVLVIDVPAKSRCIEATSWRRPSHQHETCMDLWTGRIEPHGAFHKWVCSALPLYLAC
jgi:hypothetical protein